MLFYLIMEMLLDDYFNPELTGVFRRFVERKSFSAHV